MSLLLEFAALSITVPTVHIAYLDSAVHHHCAIFMFFVFCFFLHVLCKN